MRTRIKICGLTREEDILAAADAGADAIGMVFYPRSKRSLSPARAAELRRVVPPLVSVVALFVNASEQEIEQVRQAVRPDWLQFHGDETPQQCRAAGLPYWRAFRVGAPGPDTPAALAAACQAYEDAGAWLFDSYSAGYGGSGLAFDHGLLRELPAQRRRHLVLSGGLTAQTVRQAILRSRPWAVDVSSGVESAPGIKSAEKIQAFVAQVRAADESLRAGSAPA
ncbi:phosphoribosylanthranilate isomerase [Orrella sp. JC864]|uniref:phosphoribosylanthranilate isomerase n=1 Tax=Orrella sp. JC864 TaxID=3120298 RepID=UPI003009F83B